MSIFLVKSFLALFFLLTATIAVISMLTMMGKAEKKISPKALRKMHKISGFLFFILLLVISYFCIKYWIQVGDQASVRAVFHGFFRMASVNGRLESPGMPKTLFTP